MREVKREKSEGLAAFYPKLVSGNERVKDEVMNSSVLGWSALLSM